MISLKKGGVIKIMTFFCCVFSLLGCSQNPTSSDDNKTNPAQTNSKVVKMLAHQAFTGTMVASPGNANSQIVLTQQDLIFSSQFETSVQHLGFFIPGNSRPLLKAIKLQTFGVIGLRCNAANTNNAISFYSPSHSNAFVFQVNDLSFDEWIPVNRQLDVFSSTPENLAAGDSLGQITINVDSRNLQTIYYGSQFGVKIWLDIEVAE